MTTSKDRPSLTKTASETVRIPPHPRILRALAEIDFDHWQCIAELVDNGFDEFLEMSALASPGPSHFVCMSPYRKVTVTRSPSPTMAAG